MTEPASPSAAGAVFAAAAENYDEARRRLVPCFDEFYAAALGELRFDAEAELRIVDLGAGTGLFAEMAARRFPRAEITLIDVAPEMLERARARLGDDPRFDYRVGDLASGRIPKPADAVISALAIHHLADADKIGLYSRIYQSLKPGGVFVNAEQVAGASRTLQERYHWGWLAEARRLGASQEEIDQALVRMREDRPTPLDVQLGWLREIGFAEVDCVYKNGMFAVFAGGMPTDPAKRPRNILGVARRLKRRDGA